MLLDSFFEPSPSPLSSFMEGHNLHEGSLALKRIFQPKALLSLLGQLTHTQFISLAYSQRLLGKAPVAFFQENLSLEQFSSHQGLLIGMMIALCPSSPYEGDALCPLPEKRGHVRLFSAKDKLCFDTYPVDGRYFLMAYGKAPFIYRYEPKDPHTHRLKSLGYSFGDHIS